MGGGGLGWPDQMEIRLTQPQVELEFWAELGNIYLIPDNIIILSVLLYLLTKLLCYLYFIEY